MMNRLLPIGSNQKSKQLFYSTLAALAPFLLLADTCSAQQTGNVEIYQGLVFGVGKGTFAVIIFVIIGTIMCLFKDCTNCPNFCIVLGILLPVLVFILIRSLPVKSLESDKEQSDKLPTDNYMVKTGFAVAILSLTCLMLCCVILGSNFSSQLIGRRIDSVSVRELKKQQQKEQERLEYIQR